MDSLNLEDESAYISETSHLNTNKLPYKYKYQSESENSSLSSLKKEFHLSNPIFTEMINFNLSKDDILYELSISYKNEKWIINRSLLEIKNLINSLQNLKYVFFNENYFKNLSITTNSNIKEINKNILNFLRYINYRCDILSNIITRDFFEFNKCSEPNELLNIIKRENLEQIFNFKIEESDMTLSNYIYDSDTGLLILGLEDVSYLSRIGRFWTLIDYEILGNLFVFQRVFDSESRPYFRKLIFKNFDARVSKLDLNLQHNKIFVGLENGAVQIFNINKIDKNMNSKPSKPSSNMNELSSQEEKIIAINEGNNFRYLNDRITGLQCYLDFLFISNRENKLIILNYSQITPVIKFNGSLKKRIMGKGHINDIKIDSNLKKLFVITVTDKILIYDIITCNKFNTNSESTLDVKIEFFHEIDTSGNIKNTFIKGNSIFIALENKIQIFNLGNNNLLNKDKQVEIKENLIPLDGSLEEGISYSSKFVKLEYFSFISAVCFFTDMKLIILGLVNGTILALNSRSIEVIFAKKISEHQIKNLILLEENYIVIAGDEKGNVFFFKFGI
jgi:hypothetical protein